MPSLLPVLVAWSRNDIGLDFLGRFLVIRDVQFLAVDVEDDHALAVLALELELAGLTGLGKRHRLAVDNQRFPILGRADFELDFVRVDIPVLAFARAIKTLINQRLAQFIHANDHRLQVDRVPVVQFQPAQVQMQVMRSLEFAVL